MSPATPNTKGEAVTENRLEAVLPREEWDKAATQVYTTITPSVQALVTLTAMGTLPQEEMDRGIHGAVNLALDLYLEGLLTGLAVKDFQATDEEQDSLLELQGVVFDHTFKAVTAVIEQVNSEARREALRV